MAYTKGEAYIEKDYWAEDGRTSVVLPHSCDEWAIGGREEVRQLIADLEQLLEELPEEK